MTGATRRVFARVSLLGTFSLAALRYWLTVFPRVALQLRGLRRRAGELSDPVALEALLKRSNIEGAAAFAAFVPWRRRGAVVRALVSFQAIYNYADVIAERPSPDPIEAARQAHLALPAVLAGPPGRVGRDDGCAAFVAELIAAGRGALSQLPSYDLVAARARHAAERIVTFQSLSLGSDGELERWSRAVARDQRGFTGFEWWEIAASAGSSLAVHALIAAAARPDLDEQEAAALEDAYFPAIGALHSLLDSLVDRAEDAATGQLSLIGCYATPDDAADGLERLAKQALHQARSLPPWRANALLTVAMACSYLAEAPRQEPGEARERVLTAFGPLARPAMSVFALRRLGAHPRRRPAAEPATPFDAEPHRADARAA
jgi:tetraprenyl-beta-curcumene synthase